MKTRATFHIAAIEAARAAFVDRQRNPPKIDFSSIERYRQTLEEMDLDADKALVARGRLLPTVPLISKAEIDVVVDGEPLGRKGRGMRFNGGNESS